MFCSSVVSCTYNRAVLLTEISRTVLSEHLSLSDEDIAGVESICPLIIDACAEECQVRGRHLPTIFQKAASNTPHEYVAALRPESWTWLELLAAGVHLTSQQLAASLNVAFKEREYICELAAAWGTQRRELKLSTFVERCTQSVYSQFVPTSIVSAGC